MEVVNFIHSLWIFGFIFTLESCISVNVDPDKPALGNNMTVTCQRSSSSNASISWSVDSFLLTTCDGTLDNFCVPSPTGHTFSTDVSANEFKLALATTVITDCKNYTCKDIGNSDTIAKNIQLADYSKNDITPTEPGTNTDGAISITTGCVLSPDDLTITWTKIVNGNSVALSADDPSPVTSADRSTCTRTCHTEEDKKVTSGFTHTEYTGTYSVTFQYMVSVSHSSYPDNADIYTWTSVNYTQKKATCCCDSFYNGESCKDCVNNYNCKCKCCPTPCSAFCNIRELPYWYQILWASVIGSPVAFGIWVVWRCCPNGMRKKYMQDDKSELLDDDGNTKDERLCDNEQTPKVHPERRGRGIFPPQPSPPPGTSLNKRKGSGSVVSRRDVEMHETDTSLQRGQLPNIQTPGHDNKGRGLSANFGDYDRPFVAIDIPAQKAGALPTIVDTPRETKKKTKKKKKDKQEDYHKTETVLAF